MQAIAAASNQEYRSRHGTPSVDLRLAELRHMQGVLQRVDAFVGSFVYNENQSLCTVRNDGAMAALSSLWFPAPVRQIRAWPRAEQRATQKGRRRRTL